MKNKKKNTKYILVILLLCITLGYAALRTGLNINGTANVSGSSWNVHFANYQNSQNTNITPVEEPTISGTTTTSISYEVDLEEPGDVYEFTVQIVNGGSLDALISLVSTYNGTEIDNEHPVPAYITYSVTDENGDAIVNDHQLDGGESETVKVYIKYRDDDPSVLPNNDNDGLDFDLEIVAIKAPKAAPVETGIFAANYFDKVYLGQPIPSGVRTYQTVAELEENEGISAQFFKYYLKYKLDENDLVDEAYIGFIMNDEIKEEMISMDCYGDSQCEEETNNLVNGTYYLRGGVDESSESNQSVFEYNINTIKEIFDYANNSSQCSLESGQFECRHYLFSIEAYDTGYVSVHNSVYAAQIDSTYGAYAYYG